MPTYRVQSGDMDETVETSLEATAKALAIVALDRCGPESLAHLIGVSGGQFTGDNETYLSTERVCAEMGWDVRPKKPEA